MSAPFTLVNKDSRVIVPTPVCVHCSNYNKFRPAHLQVATDHYLRLTRDRASPIACPLLKNTKCLNCGEKGHTRSHCSGYLPKHEEPFFPLKKNNRFDVLMEDSSSSSSDSDLHVFTFSIEDASNCRFRPRSPDYPPPF